MGDGQKNVHLFEDSISRLPLVDQLHLLEWLAGSIRQQTSLAQTEYGDQLRGMAADPGIQREIREIEAEFVVAETDGWAGS